MNKITPLKILWKAPKTKKEFKTLHFVNKNGELCFFSSEDALNYAKNKVVSALNYENGKRPFERGFVIHNNRILAQADGNSNSVKLKIDDKYGNLDVITVHGHPDSIFSKIEDFVRKTRQRFLAFWGKEIPMPKKETNGVAYPISYPDYTTLILSPNEKQSIVYNSKGQYSKLTKLEGSDKLGYNELKEIENEYYMNVPSGYSYQLKKCLKSFIRGFYSPEKAKALNLKDALKHRADIHCFWDDNAENLCKVKYETNYFDK